VELRHDPTPVRAARRSAKGGKEPLVGLESDVDRALFEALRAKRRELAKANGLAPFMVFADRTLIELAVKRPASAGALELIHGIGQAKRERWGDDFLRVIRELDDTLGQP
jgi:ATP-dependent DNA helicase RecQ